jgi:murein DD-endopeptidase MepM/ murein hydrolase activator NlpD
LRQPKASGNALGLDHGRGIQAGYDHLSRSMVAAGQKVKRRTLMVRSGTYAFRATFMTGMDWRLRHGIGQVHRE